MKTYLEFKDDKSAKFWEITVTGEGHTVRYGKIGSKGVTKTKRFSSEAAALADADKLVRAKTRKGYLPASSSAAADADATAAANEAPPGNKRASKTPASKTPASKTPASKTPASKTPASKKSAARTKAFKALKVGDEHGSLAPLAAAINEMHARLKAHAGVKLLKPEQAYGPLDEETIAAWEQQWRVVLPRDYRAFLLAIGGIDLRWELKKKTARGDKVRGRLVVGGLPLAAEEVSEAGLFHVWWGVAGIDELSYALKLDAAGADTLVQIDPFDHEERPLGHGFLEQLRRSVAVSGLDAAAEVPELEAAPTDDHGLVPLERVLDAVMAAAEATDPTDPRGYIGADLIEVYTLIDVLSSARNKDLEEVLVAAASIKDELITSAREADEALASQVKALIDGRGPVEGASPVRWMGHQRFPFCRFPSVLDEIQLHNAVSLANLERLPPSTRVSLSAHVEDLAAPDHSAGLAAVTTLRGLELSFMGQARMGSDGPLPARELEVLRSLNVERLALHLYGPLAEETSFRFVGEQTALEDLTVGSPQEPMAQPAGVYERLGKVLAGLGELSSLSFTPQERHSGVLLRAMADGPACPKLSRIIVPELTDDHVAAFSAGAFSKLDDFRVEREAPPALIAKLPPKVATLIAS
jgi:predicted DNA-binding WGR domain protein